MRLEVIVNNSDTTTIYSKPYKTRIPSYFTLKLPFNYVHKFISN